MWLYIFPSICSCTSFFSCEVLDVEYLTVWTSKSEQIQARAQLMSQVQSLVGALKKGDKLRTGKVSRRTFATALAKEGGLGKVGEEELTR